MSKEFDVMEYEVLKAITMCSVYTLNDVKIVYGECKSFDKTIKVINYAMEYAISLRLALNYLK